MTTAGDARPAAGKPLAASERDELAAEIRREREELGETMAALADKADVKGRVSEGAAKAKEKTADVAHKAAEKTAEVTGKAAEKTAEVSKDVAAEVSGAAEGLAEMAGKGVERVRRNPLPVIAAALAAIVAILAIRRKRR